MNGDALVRDAAYAASFGIGAALSGFIHLVTGEMGWFIGLCVCLPVAAYFAIDHWRISRRIDRQVNAETRESRGWN